ncbi:MAG: hypothetical protein QOE33_475 [Acidobacteriota bacterium]|nr:hypothetical protein [Acidobacteriota bacterium]
MSKPSEFGEDWFKFYTGLPEDEYFSFPNTDETLGEIAAQTESRYPLRKISDKLFFSEEQRPNIHIIGSSRQGKSRFIEWLIRSDINRGLGCCLLDPTAGGETALRTLAYCAEKSLPNVLYVDLDHAYSPYKKLLGLQPFKYDEEGQPAPRLRQRSIDILMGTVRALYGVKDPTVQSNIERYLPAVFAALYDNQMPLRDAEVFSSKEYVAQQKELLAFTDSASRAVLSDAFRSSLIYGNFQSTINRLIRFYRGRVGQMFSAERGVNFFKLIREHWIVIVRLDNIDTFDARLLGTYFITELEKAKTRLNQIFDERSDLKDRGKYRPYYVYADEAYMFASQALKDTLDLRQKSNFKVTLAHHTASQFTDPAVYDSIKTNCDMTVEFYTRSRKDRDEMAGEMYGGDIDPKDASYANSNLPKQTAVIKFGKRAPVRVRIPDVATPKVSAQKLLEYTQELYRRGTDLGWYYDSDKLTEPTYETGDNRKAARDRAEDDRPTNNKAARPGRAAGAQKWQVLPEDLSGRKRPAKKDG